MDRVTAENGVFMPFGGVHLHPDRMHMQQQQFAHALLQPSGMFIGAFEGAEEGHKVVHRGI